MILCILPNYNFTYISKLHYKHYLILRNDKINLKFKLINILINALVFQLTIKYQNTLNLKPILLI